MVNKGDLEAWCEADYANYCRVKDIEDIRSDAPWSFAYLRLARHAYLRHPRPRFNDWGKELHG